MIGFASAISSFRVLTFSLEPANLKGMNNIFEPIGFLKISDLPNPPAEKIRLIDNSSLMLSRPVVKVKNGKTITKIVTSWGRRRPEKDAVIAEFLKNPKRVGTPDGQMCIEAAICAALDLPHGDAPTCVASAVRSYKIALNDSNWSSSEARAKGLRSIGIAQVGSAGVVDNDEFCKRMAEGTIRRLISTLYRELFPNNQELLAAADRCELEGSREAAKAAAVYARAAAVDAGMAAAAAGWAKQATNSGDKYLLLSADICLQVLKDLNSPGCAWLERV
ncbi:unnamed protein product [Sphagnum tenellum]